VANTDAHPPPRLKAGRALAAGPVRGVHRPIMTEPGIFAASRAYLLLDGRDHAWLTRDRAGGVIHEYRLVA